MTIRDIDSLSPEDANVEKALLAAMRRLGLLFPETAEEVEALKQRLRDFSLTLPDDIDDPMKLLQNGRVRRAGAISDYSDRSVEDQLSQAAREGGDINEDIAARMRKDRDSAERATPEGDA